MNQPQTTNDFKITISWYKRTDRFYVWQRLEYYDYQAWRLLGKFTTAQEAAAGIKQEQDTWTHEQKHDLAPLTSAGI